MNRQLDLVDLHELQPNPANPKAHDLSMITRSVDHFGYVEPMVIDERTGYLISGHGRREALLAEHARGDQAPDGVTTQDGKWLVPVVRGWASRSDAEARTILVALNRTGELGGWDSEALIAVLQEVKADELLDLAGFTDADLGRLILRAEQRSDGSRLAAAGKVIMGDPEHQPSKGDHWELCANSIVHHLLVVDLIAQWSRFVPLLAGDALFVPYPGPYAPLSLRAERQPLVMVHPDTFVAGHILDRFATVNGEQSITKVPGA